VTHGRERRGSREEEEAVPLPAAGAQISVAVLGGARSHVQWSARRRRPDAPRPGDAAGPRGEQPPVVSMLALCGGCLRPECRCGAPVGERECLGGAGATKWRGSGSTNCEAPRSGAAGSASPDPSRCMRPTWADPRKTGMKENPHCGGGAKGWGGHRGHSDAPDQGRLGGQPGALSGTGHRRGWRPLHGWRSSNGGCWAPVRGWAVRPMILNPAQKCSLRASVNGSS
jgi:hypothetical protein